MYDKTHTMLIEMHQDFSLDNIQKIIVFYTICLSI